MEQFIEYKIYIKGKSEPIEEQYDSRSRIGVADRFARLMREGVFMKATIDGKPGGTWYPPDKIDYVEYRQTHV